MASRLKIIYNNSQIIMIKKQNVDCAVAPSYPPVVSLVGKPASGKTTLLEKLIPELVRQGYRIGTIKHHVHDFEMDKPGKDTWRHKQAGAHTVVLSSPAGLGVIRDTTSDTSIAELVIRYFHDVDLVITEGYKRELMPKIELFRSAAHKNLLSGRDESWIAFISDVEIKPTQNLPVFNIDDIQKITAFLVARFIKPLPEPDVFLQVNGKSVPLNFFVRKFIKHSIIGMTTSLKGCQNPEEITITIRCQKEENKP